MGERDHLFRVLRAQSGDREALGELLEEVQAPLFRCIRGIVVDRPLAEDVLQDVFVILCRKLIWLRDPALFRSWAYRIASREAIRRLRKERGRRETADPDLVESTVDPDTGDGPELDRAELSARLTDLVGDLSPASRAVLVLHYLEEMSLPEVAEVLGIPIGTVKSRLAYGLGMMRRQLNHE